MDSDAILSEVESCWVAVAEGIRCRNPDLGVTRIEADARWLVELLAFLRIGSDRGILPAGTLNRLDQGNQSEPHLAELARLVEDRLGEELVWVESSGKSRLPRGEPLGARIDGPKLSRVLRRFADKGFVRHVSNAPVELLGTIHQHLLGKRLRRVPKGGYRVETSAGQKKAAGIYYTPECVVRYIVANVLERMLDSDRTSGALFDGRLLDPACGCGWFLLSAYRFLAERLQQSGNGDLAAVPAERIFGVDLDPGAVLAARRSLWLEILAGQRQPDGRAVAALLAGNIRCGDALAGPMLDGRAGRFSAVIGNPPYRRELNGKALLERIGATEFGRRWRAPRMDLWYYFVHRGLELLEPGGRLSFIVGSYWTSGSGARKLIEALRESAHLEEIFSLEGLAVFPGISGRHMILTLTRGKSTLPTLIKAPSPGDTDRAEPFVSGRAPLIVFRKTPEQLFRDGRIDLEPPADELLARLSLLPRLEELGKVRQGIAENPARVTRTAARQHGGPWRVGEGVFALTSDELDRLRLPERAGGLIRPYHHLGDLDRYYLAGEASGVLIYSTAQTCPDVDRFPAIRDHLARFRPIMDARRETRLGARPWWQLHWPREAWLWESPKLIALQMARRPSFVAAPHPVYVPFSANVFVPNSDTEEHLNYFAAVLNSRLIWKWYQHHAKRRGIGMDLGGHAIRQTPIRRIDFSDRADVAKHDRLVELAGRLMGLSRRPRVGDSGKAAELEAEVTQADEEIDSLVYDLYGLGQGEIGAVEMSTRATEYVAAS
jgi:Eco57I restriction-modification methylase